MSIPSRRHGLVSSSLRFAIRRNAKICLIAALLLSPACTPKPTQQLNDARVALESARRAEADIYSSEAFHSAATAFKGAQVELRAQEQKRFWSRKYHRAEELIREAESRAEKAAATAAGNRERAKAAAQSAEAEAGRAVESARKAAWSGSERTRSRHEPFTVDLEAAERSLREARSSYGEGRFLDALNQFLAAREKADAVVSDLNQTERKRP